MTAEPEIIQKQHFVFSHHVVCCGCTTFHFQTRICLWEYFHVNNIFGSTEHTPCFLSSRMTVILHYYNPLMDLSKDKNYINSI